MTESLLIVEWCWFVAMDSVFIIVGVLIAAGIAGIGSITIVPFLFYQGFLLISVLISIIFGIGIKKEKE